MRGRIGATVCATLLLGASLARAGWEIEQTSYSLRASGKEISRTTASLRIAAGKVRVADGKTITIVDYGKDRLTYIYPEKKIYWVGSSDDYIAAIQGSNPRRRKVPKEDSEARRGKVVIQETPITTEIAGKTTKKYIINVDGEKIQDVWMAPSFGVGKDLDFEVFSALQGKLARSVRSSRGRDLVALSQDEAYKALNRDSFAMRTHSYLGEAIMGTEIVRVAQIDVPESEFAVPEGYTAVPLLSLLEVQGALTVEERAEIDAKQKARRAGGAAKGAADAPKK